MRTPKPKVVSTVCTECGQDWAKHKANAKGTVPLDECVRLLKAALAEKPSAIWTYPAQSGSAFSTFTPTV